MSAIAAQKFNDLLHSRNNILLISHLNPDGDTLGAALSLSIYLDSQHKQHQLYCLDQPASYYQYLPNIANYLIGKNQINFKDFDLIVILDHGSITQSGCAAELTDLKNSAKQELIVNIDHHASNDFFGHHNMVDVTASSTCEAMYNIYKSLNIEVCPRMATCLMTGIIVDTSTFTNAATKDSSLVAASELIKAGASIPKIANQVIKNKNIPSLNLWGEVFTRLVINPRHQLAYTVITHQDLEKNYISREAIDGLVNFLNGLKDIKIVMLLIEEEAGLIKGSLRTTHSDIDVSKMAAQWGGGGHKQAAGFRIKGRLIQVGSHWQVEAVK